MKIIVCGSRNLPKGHAWRVSNALWSLYQLAGTMNHETFEVVHGGCPDPADPDVVSVDQVASSWVKRGPHGNGYWLLQVIESVHPADWDQFGKAAGPIRNKKMAVGGADLCLGFLWEPGGRPSYGTRDMIRQAGIQEIPVWSVTLS